MAWRIRPDEILLEVGRLFGSKVGLQKLNYEVSYFFLSHHTLIRGCHKFNKGHTL